MSLGTCYDVVFDPNFENSAAYHDNLKALYPESGWVINTKFDREYIILGEKVSFPPLTRMSSNKNIINVFSMVLSQRFFKLPIYVYPADHFDAILEHSIAAPSVTPDKYVKVFYEKFKANDHSILVKEVLVFPCNYGHTWHTVVVDKPMNSVTEGKVCNIYFISTHTVTPHFSLAKVVTKYMTMAFAAMSLDVIPGNFQYHELVHRNRCNQAQVVCCLYTELAFRIVEEKRDMGMLFHGINPEVLKLKMDNYIFGRYLQTLFNCFAVEHNEYGQIAHFDVLMIEPEDYSWNPNTDIGRILDPSRQMRNIRPIRQFAPKRDRSPRRGGENAKMFHPLP